MRLAVVLALFFASGIAGLVYQVVWIRHFTHLLGGTSFAVAAVLAAFMAGLALGSRAFGRKVDRHPDPLRLYAGLELGIALLGLAVPIAIALVEPIYVGIARTIPAGGLFALRIAVALAILLPPTFLMGGTLPVLGRYLVRSRNRLGRGIGALYAVNTAGAVLGTFLAGFFLVERFGLAGATAFAVGANVAAGLGAFALGTLGRPGTADRRDGGEDRGSDRDDGHAEVGDGGGEPVAARPTSAGATPVRARLGGTILAVLFAASGFASLGYEVYWTRALQPFLGNSIYAFSAMLTTFLLGLALGGWAGGQVADRVANPVRILAWVQIAAGAAAVLTVHLIWNVLPVLEEADFLHSGELPWSSYVGRRFLVAAAVMIVPTTLLGAVFPVVHRLGIEGLGSLGAGIGRLYFANTAGAIAGSVTAGFFVISVLGARGGILATGALHAALGVAALAFARPRFPRELALAAGATIVLAGAVAPRLATSTSPMLADTQDPEDDVLLRTEDSVAETRVYRKANGELHMSVDGFHIGGTNANILRKEKILAHLPMVLVPRAKRVLSVGLGSGITLGTFALYDEIEALTCVEIAPGVVKGAALFGEHHGDVLNDPRARIVVEDGVQFLLTSADSFDVISSDSKLNPSYVGNAPLLARDYYELCRDRLAAEGVMVQWLAVHVPASEARTVIRGFVDAFPYAALFWHDPANMVLAGSRSPIALHIDRARRFTQQGGALARNFETLQLEEPYVFPALYVAGGDRLRTAVGNGPVSTWADPVIEFTMIREFRAKRRATHEDDNLAWLARTRDAEGLTVLGDPDLERLARFRSSAGMLLRGFAAGGGIRHLETGATYFREGLRENPEDRRLRLLLDYLERPIPPRSPPATGRAPG